jgi:hypothetical protein
MRVMVPMQYPRVVRCGGVPRHACMAASMARKHGMHGMACHLHSARAVHRAKSRARILHIRKPIFAPGLRLSLKTTSRPSLGRLLTIILLAVLQPSPPGFKDQHGILGGYPQGARRLQPREKPNSSIRFVQTPIKT